MARKQKQPDAPLMADAYRDRPADGQRAIDQKGDIWEYQNGRWVRTGLNEQQSVPVGIGESIGAGAAKVLSAPLRMFDGERGREDAATLDRYYGQNPIAYGTGQALGAVPSAVAGGGLGVGAGLIRNTAIQGAIGAVSDAEDPLTGALLAAGVVGGSGLLGMAGRGRGVARAAPVVDEGMPARPVMAPAPGVPGAPMAGTLGAQPAGTFTSRGAMPGRPAARAGSAGEPQMLGPGAADDISTSAIGRNRRPMDAAQLAEARGLGLDVPPGYQHGSDLLQNMESRTGVQTIMDVGKRRNQNLLTAEAGRAAGIADRAVNRFTLDAAMESTQNGFAAVASEAKPVSKSQFEGVVDELTRNKPSHAEFFQRLKEAPDMLDGRQLSALQSFLANERRRAAHAVNINRADVYDRAHESVLNLIERRLPEGSRGNFTRLRQEYQGQMALNRPGVLGAGDSVNPKSYISAVGLKTKRGSPELLRAQKMAKHMANWGDVLPMTGARNSGWSTAAGATLAALLGGGPIGAAMGGAAGFAANRMAPQLAYDAYKRAAPSIMGLMDRGAGGF